MSAQKRKKKEWEKVGKKKGGRSNKKGVAGVYFVSRIHSNVEESSKRQANMSE